MRLFASRQMLVSQLKYKPCVLSVDFQGGLTGRVP
jgi:hypothetical protein